MEDVELVRGLIRRHVNTRQRPRGSRVLDGWRDMAGLFVKVMPRDYKRVLAAQAKAAAEGRPVEFSELVGAG